jgi:hypothetical protein
VLDIFQRGERHAYVARLDAHHSARSLFVRAACWRTDLLVLSGRDVTDSAGKLTLTLDNLLCGAMTEGLPSTLMLLREPKFVATAHGAAPVVVTAATHATAQPQGAGVLVNDRGVIRSTRIPSWTSRST